MLCSMVFMILLYFIIVIVHGQFSSLINPSYFQEEAFKLTSTFYLFSSSQSLWWNGTLLSLATQVSLLNLHGRDNLRLMKCFNFQLGKFCSINIKCWGDTSCFKLCRVFLSSQLRYSMSRYYNDVFKFEMACWLWVQ